MVLSEVDILSASLIMISFALFVRRRSALAGAAFGAAMLCTPISATMLPLFVLAPPPSSSTDQRDGRALVRVQALRVLHFGLVALVVYVPFVAAYYNAYVYGPRGLTTAPHEAFAWLPPIRRGAAFFKEN